MTQIASSVVIWLMRGMLTYFRADRFVYIGAILLKNYRTLLITGTFVSLFYGSAEADVLFDSNGFEAAAGYTLGNLKGQVVGSSLPWQVTTGQALSGGPSLATLENMVSYQGNQAVEFNRLAADRDTYYAPVLNAPTLTQRYLNVNWTMNVSPGAGSDPFFGIYAYNGNDSLAYAGVDASTGQVEYSQTLTGGLMSTASSVSLGTWNTFDLQFDYLTKSETLFVNGVSAINAVFIHPLETSFTDADITSFATNSAESGTGTVYFDNYQISTSNAAYVAPANLTWLNTGGTGDGMTWDVGTSQNFNNGSAPVTFNNGDNVTFNDNNNHHYAVTINTIVSPNSATVTNSAGDYVFSGSGGIAGDGPLIKNGTGNLTLSTSNTYNGGTTVNAGTLTIANSTAFPANTSLAIGAGATVIASNHGSGSVTALAVSNFSNAGLLDLNNNALILSSTTSLATANNQVALGYNNGNWNGSSGIISIAAAQDSRHVTALGVILNDSGGGTPLYGSGGTLGTFDGTNPTLDEVLVKYTYYGDANLDGVVDASDYTRIDNGILQHLTGWYNGDFNYDGVINGSDYTLIDNAFNTQGASLAAVDAAPLAEIAEPNVSAVPEPIAIGIFAMVSLGLRRSRRLTLV